MSRSLTYEEWVVKETGLSPFRFNQLASENQDRLLKRYLEYRGEENEAHNRNFANKQFAQFMDKNWGR